MGVKTEIIPSPLPIQEPVILPNSEYQRLRKEAKVLTPAQKKAIIDEAERQKAQKLLESQQRKENLKKTHKIQVAVPGSKLESEETEAANKNLYLIKRSQELQTEQEDRVKKANTIILATKCRAIRNAQLAEKKLIEKQLQEENKRLDLLMEQTRLEKVEAEERRREEAEIRRQKYIKEVEQQVREKEMSDLLEAEKFEEESRMVKKAFIALQKEDEQKAIERTKLKHKLRDEFLKTSEEAEYFKKIKEQEDKFTEMRIKEYQRLKQERDEAMEKENAAKNAALERDKTRFLKAHGKDEELKAMMEQFRNARALEEKEKEWREKEKRAAEKRKASIEDLKRTRANQIEDSRKAQAVALSREEEDFMKVAAAQRKLHEEYLACEQKRREDKERHRLFLLKQINEKEKERIDFRMEKYEDGKLQRQEYALKDKNIDEYLGHKIDKLRGLNIPDNYIKDIERQMKAIKTK